MVNRVGQVVSQVTQSVIVGLLQVDQGGVSNVLQDEEGEGQQAGSNQVTNLEQIA